MPEIIDVDFLISLMEFYFDDNDFIWSVRTTDGKLVKSQFDSLLQKRWKSASEAGVCRYQLTNLQTKVLSGTFGFVAQLNANRATQRRVPQNLQKVNNSFDPIEFNFNKVAAQEVLLKPVHKEASGKMEDNAAVIINVSPLEFGNSLLVPSVTGNIPQRVTQEGLDLLVRLMLLSSDVNLKAGFNSPGGYASVNHQHYHLYYLRERLYLEKASVEHIAGPCFALTDFPSKGFAFQLHNDPALLAKNVFILVSYLCANEIAHNLFVTRGKRFDETPTDAYDTIRVFVWAREASFGVKEEIGFNPALCELAGHLLIKEPLAYEVVTEKDAAEMLDSITRPWYHQVRENIHNLFLAT